MPYSTSAFNKLGCCVLRRKGILLCCVGNGYPIPPVPVWVVVNWPRCPGKEFKLLANPIRRYSIQWSEHTCSSLSWSPFFLVARLFFSCRYASRGLWNQLPVLSFRLRRFYLLTHASLSSSSSPFSTTLAFHHFSPFYSGLKLISYANTFHRKLWSTLFLYGVCMLRECIYGQCAH